MASELAVSWSNLRIIAVVCTLMKLSEICVASSQSGAQGCRGLLSNILGASKLWAATGVSTET